MVPVNITPWLEESAEKTLHDVEILCNSRKIYFGATLLLEVLLRSKNDKVFQALRILTSQQHHEIAKIVAQPYNLANCPGEPTVTGQRIWANLTERANRYGSISNSDLCVALFKALESSHEIRQVIEPGDRMNAIIARLEGKWSNVAKVRWWNSEFAFDPEEARDTNKCFIGPLITLGSGKATIEAIWYGVDSGPYHAAASATIDALRNAILAGTVALSDNQIRQALLSVGLGELGTKIDTQKSLKVNGMRTIFDHKGQTREWFLCLKNHPYLLEH